MAHENPHNAGPASIQHYLYLNARQKTSDEQSFAVVPRKIANSDLSASGPEPREVDEKSDTITGAATEHVFKRIIAAVIRAGEETLFELSATLLILGMLAVKMAFLSQTDAVHEEWLRQFTILYAILSVLSLSLIFVGRQEAKFVLFVFIVGIGSVLAVPFQGIEAVRVLLLYLVLIGGFACRTLVTILVAPAAYIGLALLFMGKQLAWPQSMEILTQGDLLFLGGIGVISAVLLAFFLGKLTQARTLDKQASRLRETIEELSAANLGYSSFTQLAKQQSALEERKRITREIHDGVGYTLTNIIMLSEVTLDICPPEDARLKENIAAIRMQAKNGLFDTRRALRELRSTDKGLPRGISAIESLITTYKRATGIEAKVEQYVEDRVIEQPSIFLTIYRFIQEALTNTFRHGHANNAWIRFQRVEDWLIISVSDNGMGASTVTEGIGLQGMRERIEFLGGELRYQGLDGFTVIARLPIREGNE